MGSQHYEKQIHHFGREDLSGKLGRFQTRKAAFKGSSEGRVLAPNDQSRAKSRRRRAMQEVVWLIMSQRYETATIGRTIKENAQGDNF